MVFLPSQEDGRFSFSLYDGPSQYDGLCINMHFYFLYDL